MFIKQKVLCIIFAICLPFSSVLAQADVGKKGDKKPTAEQLLQQQKDTLEAMQVDLNKSGSDLYDDFTTPPQSMEESGCLTDARSLTN